MKAGVLGKKRFALGSSGSDRNETFEALQASVRSLFKSVFDPERGRLAVYMGTTRPENSNGSSQRMDSLPLLGKSDFDLNIRQLINNLKTCFLKNIRKSNYDVLCVPIIHEIKKLQGGKSKVFEYYIKKDRMECTHLKVATIFKNITQGSYIRKQTKPDSKGNMKVLIYKYNDETQLWDNTTDLKTHFIDTIKTYCALLCLKRGSVGPLNEKTFKENYTEKDKDEKDIYLKRRKI